MKFYYMDIIQKELVEVAKGQNTVHVRPYPNQKCPSRNPEISTTISEVCSRTIWYILDESKKSGILGKKEMKFHNLADLIYSLFAQTWFAFTLVSLMLT